MLKFLCYKSILLYISLFIQVWNITMVSMLRSWLSRGNFPISEEDRQNITYKRQRYWSRERELEISPDTKDLGKEVVIEDMGEPKRRKGIAFDSVLKPLSDLAK